MKSALGLSILLAIVLRIDAASFSENGKLPILYELRNRIFGGIIASPGTFPYMVPLWVERVNKDGMEYGTFCGSSLISDEYLLTAAHCVAGDPEGAKVYLGAQVISRDSEEGRVDLKIPKENIILHESYDWTLFKNDIALIRLPQKVQFSREIKAVRLPSRSQTNLVKRIAVVTGWGAMGQHAEGSDLLRYAQLRIINDDFCRSIYGKYYHSSNICIEAARQSPCSGDSGGAAVVVEKDKSFTQVGVASYVSHQGCEVGNPVAYTRVSAFLDWIHQHTGIPIAE